MRIEATAPIAGTTLNAKRYPFVIEGEGESALRVYFETEESRQVYPDIEVEYSGL